ncbi:MAG: 4-hydroxybenzoate polyprenyltransferase [Bifidobacterium sp.]|jgi:hypothetical protein|nr:4-hydroxybenzoate polyprenyltransferase [Bifidobacterium sp.]
MAAHWSNITRDEESGLPTMLVQAVAIAGVLCVGELLCAPIYVNLAYGKVALLPWAMVACLLAVAFTYTVGFALLWCVESLGGKLRPSLMPVAYASAGLVGFAAWGYAVYPAFLDSILKPLGLPALSGGSLAAVGFNCAVLGFASFFLGSIALKFLSRRKGVVIAIGVLTLLFAAFGAYTVASVYAVLY